METQVLKTLDIPDSLVAEWNDLLACCSASHVPFLRYEYLRAWQAFWGGGEWPEGELFVFMARHHGRLVGVAPLFLTTNAEGQKALMLLGSIEISDYLDLIADAARLPAFAESLLAWLASPEAPAWDVLDLYNLPANSATLDALQAAAQGREWRFAQAQLQPCPTIALPGDWDTYLANIDKKQRHEIRRKIRRAEEGEKPAAWYIVEDAATLDDEIEAFMTLMAFDPEKERFLTPTMRLQMQAICRAAFAGGWLQLAFLTVGGEKAAAYLNFDYAGHIWVYNSGINFAMRDVSPGWVLLGYLLQWANENKRQNFDFMRGDEGYKYRFGGVNRYIVRASITR